MSVNGEPKVNELDRIANYIKKLKFKKAVMGGIEQESVYQAMRELVSMFTEIYTAETEKSSQMESRLQELTQAQSSVDFRVQDLKEQAARRAEKLKAEYEALKRKLEAENTALKSQLKKESDSHAGELSGIQAENNSLKDELQAATEENERLSAQLQELHEHVNESDFQRETLEEIYLDANRRRMEILDSASAEAEGLKRSAANENAEEQQRFAAEMEAWKAEFAQEKKRLEDERDEAAVKFEETLAERRAQAASEEEESRARGEAMIREAEEKAQEIIANAEAESSLTLNEAQAEAYRRRAEAEEMVASAQAKYKNERLKYDGMIRRLGELRTEILHSIQRDVNQLQSLAFYMSGSGIEAETENMTGVDQLSDLLKAGEDA